MKILDKYIIKQFLGTFLMMSILLTTITVVIDISNKINRLSENGSSIEQALVEFYPYWSIWIINTFLPIAVFISVIFFTSKMANDTEIVAITSSGISFFRFARPYLISAGILTIFSLGINHFLLPKANVQKNKFEYQYLLSGREENVYNETKSIAVKLSSNEYLFINEYRRSEKRGSGFKYQKFNALTLVKNIRANQIFWQESDSTFRLSNFYLREIDKDGKEKLSSGSRMNFEINVTPDELLPESYAAEVMDSPSLLAFIKRETEKGSANVNTYLTEYKKRTSISFSIIILTILALSLASEKRRGGIGTNLAIGLLLAFVYIFLSEMMSTFSENNVFSPSIAAWLPNILFGVISIFLFIRRAYQ